MSKTNEKKLENGGLLRIEKKGGNLNKVSNQKVDEENLGLNTIEPEYDFCDLIAIYEINNTARKCIEIIAKNVVSNGYSFVAENGESDSQAKSIEYMKTIFGNINPDKTFMQIINDMIIDLETTGNAALEISRGMDGKPDKIYNMPIDTMRFVKGNDFKIGTRFVQNSNYQRGSTVKFNKYYADADLRTAENGFMAPDTETGPKINEVIWFRLPNPKSQFYGLSPAVPLLKTYLVSKYCEEYNINEFENGMLSKFAIIMKNGSLTQESIDSLTSFMQEMMSSEKRRSQIPILSVRGNNAEVAIEHLTGEKKDGSYLDLLKYNRQEVIVAYGVPPIMLGIVEDANRSNGIEQEKKFWQKEIMPLQSMIEFVFTKMINLDFGIQGLKFQFNRENRNDREKTNVIVSQGIKDGRYSINEGRSLMGDDILKEDGANERFVYLPSGMINVKDLDNLSSEPALATTGKSQGEIIVEQLLGLKDKIAKRAKHEAIKNGTDDGSDEYPEV